MLTADVLERMASKAALYSATLTLSLVGLKIEMSDQERRMVRVIAYVELVNARFPAEIVGHHLMDMHDQFHRVSEGWST